MTRIRLLCLGLIALPGLLAAQDVELTDLRPGMLVRVQQKGDYRVIGFLTAISKDSIAYRPGLNRASTAREVRLPIDVIATLDYRGGLPAGRAAKSKVPGPDATDDIVRPGLEACGNNDPDCIGYAGVGVLYAIGKGLGKAVNAIEKKPAPPADGWRHVRIRN